MFCVECGAPLVENQRFCSACGASAGAADLRPETTARPPVPFGETTTQRHLGKSGLLWAGIAVAGVLAVAGLFLISRSGGNASLTKTILVPGNQDWTPTGIFLKRGASVGIVASGSVSMGGGWTPLPPAGKPQSLCSIGFPLPQVPCWSLIGRIGEQGAPFYVGNQIAIGSMASGQLFLGVNDNQLGDNSGSWTAVVTVTSGLAAAPMSQVPGPTTLAPQRASGAPTVNLFAPAINGLQVSMNGLTLPSVQGATITQIAWNWGDGTPVQVGWFPQSHTYQQAGAYDVTVRVTDSSGLNSSAREAVRIVPASPATVAVGSAEIHAGASIQLPPGNFYIYGMATGGGAASSAFSVSPYAQAVDAGGALSVALAYGTNNQNSFTTQTAFHVIGGASITGTWEDFRAFYGSNAQPGAASASVNFVVPGNSLVVVVGLASSQQSVTLEGVPGLQVDASSSGPEASEGMVIAHAYLPPGAYTAGARSAALAGGQSPQNMADLIGVFVFGSRQ